MDFVRRIPERGDPCKPGHKLFDELHALAADLFIENAQPCHVASGAPQARHQAEAYGIRGYYDDGDRSGDFLGHPGLEWR